MENIQIDVNDYIDYGLGDIYYSLISFISKYVTENYNPMEVFENGDSEYSIAVATMKSSLKELLNYLKTVDEVYIPKLNKNVKLSSLTINEQLALEERCKEYLIIKLNETLNTNLEESSQKSIN